MASNQTSNYGLNQWEATDQVLRTDFNQDNAKLDAALKGLADKDTALEGTLASQAAAISKLGNCRIQCITYTGSGSGSRLFTFSGKPLFVSAVGAGYSLTAIQGISQLVCAGRGTVEAHTATWSGNSVTFSNSSNLPHYICNLSGQSYGLVAFMDANG